jgi:hypothetical protein
MKTAILLSGQANNYKHHYDNYLAQIRANFPDADVYISTMRVPALTDIKFAESPYVVFSGLAFADKIMPQEIIDSFNPRMIEFEQYDKNHVDYLTGKMFRYPWIHHDTNIFNVMAQYYKKYRVMQLFDPSYYDFAIYYRFDMSTFGEIHPYTDRLCIPMGNNCRGGMGDVMAYGNPQLVADFLDLFNHFDQCYDELGFIHPEICLRHYLVDIKHIPVYRTALQCNIRNNPYNQITQKEHFDQFSFPYPGVPV